MLEKLCIESVGVEYDAFNIGTELISLYRVNRIAKTYSSEDEIWFDIEQNPHLNKEIGILPHVSVEDYAEVLSDVCLKYIFIEEDECLIDFSSVEGEDKSTLDLILCAHEVLGLDVFLLSEKDGIYEMNNHGTNAKKNVLLVNAYDFLKDYRDRLYYN